MIGTALDSSSGMPMVKMLVNRFPLLLCSRVSSASRDRRLYHDADHRHGGEHGPG